jgi:hypothetical protein
MHILVKQALIEVHHVLLRHRSADVRLPAEAVIDAEVRSDLPVVLGIKGDIVVVFVVVLNSALGEGRGITRQEVSHGNARGLAVEPEVAVAVERSVDVLHRMNPVAAESELVITLDEA